MPYRKVKISEFELKWSISLHIAISLISQNKDTQVFQTFLSFQNADWTDPHKRRIVIHKWKQASWDSIKTLLSGKAQKWFSWKWIIISGLIQVSVGYDACLHKNLLISLSACALDAAKTSSSNFDWLKRCLKKVALELVLHDFYARNVFGMKHEINS